MGDEEKKQQPDMDREFLALRERYFNIMQPIFTPIPDKHDIVDFFASILRVVGMEDGGWDPFEESRGMILDMDHLMKIDLPISRFPDENHSKWRFGLLQYSHAVEVDAVYELIANILRYHLGEGYSPSPFFKYLTEKRQKSYRKKSMDPLEKIAIIKQLGGRLGCPAGELLEEFYDNKLRNAIAHSDFILSETEFRCRGGTGGMQAYKMPLDKVADILLKTRAFYSAFWGLEAACRKYFAQHYANKAIPYDPHYKGMLEVLANGDGMMSGFKIHWPNKHESTYVRHEDGIDMCNIFLGKDLKIEMNVGLYPKKAGTWSLVLAEGDMPNYTPLANGNIPIWPEEL